MKCCYCGSSYGQLIDINGSWWHLKCLHQKERYEAYVKGEFTLKKEPKLINPIDRHKQIYEYIIEQNQPITVNKLVNHFKYSRTTIVVSLNFLTKQKLISISSTNKIYNNK